MPFNPDSSLQAEIATQPDDWRAGGPSRVGEVTRPCRAAGERVAVVGCGTSFSMAQAYAALRERPGRGDRAFAGQRARAAPRVRRVLAITRSGTTTEVLDVLTGAARSGAPTTVVVADARDAGDRARRHGDRCCPRSTSSRWCRPGSRRPRSRCCAPRSARTSTGPSPTPAAVLAEPEDAALAGLVDAEQVTFVGRGWTVGLAEEAALKLRESAQFWTESYPAMEYRHGPISIAAPGRATWAFGAVPDGLAEQVAATGAHFEHRDLDPLAELVRVHRLCLAKARQADVDPDNPRHLTRSVVLDRRTTDTVRAP